MSERDIPSVVRGRKLIMQFPVNDHFQIGIFQGKISEFDILIKYKQLINGKWTKPRTPKHIHWAVDILIKQHEEPAATDEFLHFLLKQWESINPIRSEADRDKILNFYSLMDEVEMEAKNYAKLADKGEYSIKFLILLTKLLMLQEKTNRKDAYMFKNVLDKLRDHSEIFSIVSTATFNGFGK